ncbi:hypothetical protein ACQ86N_27795 [Puia sp. P3]|uniref:hypothetical protein n=1 Tax=Puia sp. P3 TaxID=3423952 RepID=UPI003D677CC1
MLITTKKGGVGGSKVSVNVYSGIGKVAHWIPMLNTQQYLSLRREAFKNDGVNPATAPSRPYDLLDWDQNAYTNWQKFLIGGSAHSSNAEVAWSGGNANTFIVLAGRSGMTVRYIRETGGTTALPRDTVWTIIRRTAGLDFLSLPVSPMRIRGFPTRIFPGPTPCRRITPRN